MLINAEINLFNSKTNELNCLKFFKYQQQVVKKQNLPKKTNPKLKAKQWRMNKKQNSE